MLNINNDENGDAVLAAQAILNNSVSFLSVLQKLFVARLKL